MTTSFTDLGVSARVIEALGKGGVSDPFAIQSLVLKDAIAGRDVLARSATGSGKTLAFALPIVERATSQAAASSLGRLAGRGLVDRGEVWPCPETPAR